MRSHDEVEKDVQQWLALYLVEARIEECLFYQKLAKKDEEVFGIMKNDEKELRNKKRRSR